MLNNKRKFVRYNINFSIYSNQINGKGVNISQDGFGFITEDELIPAENVPFHANLNGFVFNKKKYLIEGRGRLLFSIFFKSYNSYYNGFQFIKLDNNSKKTFYQLLEKIKEQKKIKSY